MNDVPKKAAAVRALVAKLFDAMQPRALPAMQQECCKALKLHSGIAAVDAAFPHVAAQPSCLEAPVPKYQRVQERLSFLQDVLEALGEPKDAGSGRGRKRMAEQAAEHMRMCGELLAKLGNEGMRAALGDAAAVIAACAARERIDRMVLSNTPIVPGMHALVTRHPVWQSSHFAGARGPSSHRAELIRFVSRHLRTGTSAAIVSTLVQDAMGVPCTADDVRRARGVPPAPRLPRQETGSWNDRVGRLLKR